MMDGSDVGMQQMDYLVPISVAINFINLFLSILFDFFFFMNDHICLFMFKERSISGLKERSISFIYVQEE